MEQRKVVHFEIAPALLSDIVRQLEALPGTRVRDVMNRLENLTGTDELKAIFDTGNLGGAKRTDPPPPPRDADDPVANDRGEI